MQGTSNSAVSSNIRSVRDYSPKLFTHLLEYLVFIVQLFFLLVFFLFASNANAGKPLIPIDTSSPRDTMQSFLNLTAETADLYQDFRNSPNQSTQDALLRTTANAMKLFDLSQVAPANRHQVAGETFYLLWEVLARKSLPELADVPALPAYQAADDKPSVLTRWRIPNTQITINLIKGGPYEGEYRFSADTVKNARSNLEMLRESPYIRPMRIKDAYRINELFTGWMIPVRWTEALPDWAKYSLSGQVLWKWFVALILSGVWFGVIITVYKWGRKKTFDGSLYSYLRYMTAPVVMLVLIFLFEYLATEQVFMTGVAAQKLQSIVFISYGITLVWIVWLSVNQVAETIISSPRVKERSLDASLLRLVSRAIGTVAILVLVFKVLDNLGVPVAGLITGAGVGGAAVVLAAQNTLQNFMGALNLFVDRPVRVGDLCRYDEASSPGRRPIGIIESIGLRSTRIRRFDRTLITIPNADFAQRNIINISNSDRFLLSTSIGLRYETTDDQLRYVLVELRKLLHAHPKTVHTANDPIRVRFVGFDDCSLKVSMNCYIKTKSNFEFLAIQEDILLRIMKLIDQAGTSFAFPSSTVYLSRDGGLDKERQQAAEKQLQEWALEQSMPFPDFTEDYRKQITDTLDYPPEGSPDADT